ncbi:HmuY family protein [Dyadobacter sandarakinus]|uniref:HmuY family protein n=1 Tax=Dyadobacter sandarakinus TaxID=2747268 RepID=A0ABX7IBS7_9BACT|nr:HmuY family protein [Dyadobacter sandarakinus]QRR03440.1 HmuY family protein [Dyadobacter sandarakinus]
MKNLRLQSICILAAFVLMFSACSDDDSDGPAVTPELTIHEVKDLDGSAESRKDSVFFSFSQNKEVSATENWDLKFKSTTISTSGTAQVVALTDGTLFDSYTTAPAAGYTANAIAGSGSWYNYTAETEPQHAILPVPGKIIVVKTKDGKYAKMEMISYYKGNPGTNSETFKDLTRRPAGKTYTFRYAFQADGSTNLK